MTKEPIRYVRKVRRGRYVGWGEGTTPAEARRAAEIDAADQHAMRPDKPTMRPSTVWLVIGLLVSFSVVLATVVIVWVAHP